jgi:hypothetical protein
VTLHPLWRGLRRLIRARRARAVQLWWRDTPVPPHVPVEEHAEYRTHMEREVRQSCKLLAAALDGADVRRFAPLFEPEVTGHLLGMFELNNLAVLVASPVEMFFVEADPAGGKADESTEPHMDTLLLLGALGDAYQIPCEGTGFYALQVGLVSAGCVWILPTDEQQGLRSSYWRTGERGGADGAFTKATRFRSLSRGSGGRARAELLQPQLRAERGGGQVAGGCDGGGGGGRRRAGGHKRHRGRGGDHHLVRAHSNLSSRCAAAGLVW